MLVITVDAEPAMVTLRLVGHLAGLEARELERTRIAVGFEYPHHPVMFDLTGITAVEVAGKEYLAQAHRRGDGLVGEPTSKAIVDEIIARSGIESSLDGEAGAVRDRLSGRVHAVFSP